MNQRVAVAAETHLNDLQADVEAGSRQIDRIHGVASEIFDTLIEKQLDQAGLMGSLVRQIRDLRRSVRQQQLLMRELRRDIRAMRANA